MFSRPIQVDYVINDNWSITKGTLSSSWPKMSLSSIVRGKVNSRTLNSSHHQMFMKVSFLLLFEFTSVFQTDSGWLRYLWQFKLQPSALYLHLCPRYHWVVLPPKSWKPIFTINVLIEGLDIPLPFLKKVYCIDKQSEQWIDFFPYFFTKVIKQVVEIALLSSLPRILWASYLYIFTSLFPVGIGKYSCYTFPSDRMKR